MKFRKKPVIIEAVRWVGENTDEILSFGNSGPRPIWGDDFKIDTAKKEVLIATLEGYMVASAGDWIIRGVKGEFYPCKPDVFEATYESVSFYIVTNPHPSNLDLRGVEGCKITTETIQPS